MTHILKYSNTSFRSSFSIIFMQKKKEKKGKVRISLKASAVNLATPTLLPGFNAKHDNTVIRCRKSQMMFKTYISIYNFALFSLHQWFSYCKNDEKLLEKLTSVKEKSQFVWPRGKLIKQLPPQHCWHTAGTDITIFKCPSLCFAITLTLYSLNYEIIGISVHYLIVYISFLMGK